MARRERALTKDTTQTAGTGTYTLDGASAAGYQTLAEAVARGLAANGDEVIYRVSDAASPVLYEVGRGTIGSAGLTVTRAEILERDDGSTSPKSWPSGGARNFVVTFWPGELLKAANNLSDVASANTAADNIGAARLNAANTLTDKQTLRKDGSGGQVALDLANLATPSTGNRIAQRVLLLDDGSNQTIAFQLDSRLSTITNGAEVGTTDLYSQAAGALSKAITIIGTNVSIPNGTLTGTGTKYVAFPTGGTVKMLFAGAPGADWTRSNETNPSVIRLATAADTLNATGGSSNIFTGWSTAGHTLQVTEIPSHSHDHHHTRAFNMDNTGGATFMQSPAAPGGGNAFNSTTSTGGGGAHSHAIATPYYRIAAWYTFN